MHAFAQLFSTDYGILSIAVIVFTLFMGWWYGRFFKRKMDESEREARAQQGASGGVAHGH